MLKLHTFLFYYEIRKAVSLFGLRTCKTRCKTAQQFSKAAVLIHESVVILK